VHQVGFYYIDIWRCTVNKTYNSCCCISSHFST